MDELVKPHLRTEWDRLKSQWFPRTDTPEHAAYDRRTPGLFKVEWEGDGFVGLAAKTYYCYNTTDPTLDKYSSKGVNRTLKLTRDHFLSVLRSKQPVQNTNRGFISRDRAVLTYSLKKDGLSYLYCKRKVLDDGISTTYLDV